MHHALVRDEEPQLAQRAVAIAVGLAGPALILLALLLQLSR